MKKTYYYIFLFISIVSTFLYYIFSEKIIVKTWSGENDGFIMKLHPKIRALVSKFVNDVEKKLNIQLKITSTLRTFEEQAVLYAKGRTTGGGIVTNASAGQSYHNYGLAVDFYDNTNKTFHINEKTAQIGESLGFEWGGRWTKLVDKPHFQMTFKKNWSELKELYDSGQTDKDLYVNI